MQQPVKILSILLLVMIVMSACSLPEFLIQSAAPTQPPAPTAAMDSQEDVGTSVAQTVEALSTRLAIVPSETMSPAAETQTPQAAATNTTQPSAINTPQAVLTFTQTATVTSPPTLTSAPTKTVVPVPCNKVTFVSDVTVADGTSFSAGTSFIKTWRLRNSGSCTWSTSYALVFDSGSAMNGPAAMNLPASVAPGQTIDLSVALVAPSSNGTYQGFWKLQDASGVRFGLGASASSSFWVKISVGNTSTPGPSPTATNVSASGECSLVSSSPSNNAVYPPSASFDTRWKVKNTGDDIWKTDEVDVKYLGGTKWFENKDKDAFDLPTEVDPDEEYELILDSIAPSSVGVYTMTWGLVRSGTTLCSMSKTIRVK